MTRRLLIVGEGATELRAPGERWTGVAYVLLQRMLGSPPGTLLSFETHVLSNFGRIGERSDGERTFRGEDQQARIARMLAARNANGLVLLRDNDQSARRPHGDRRSAIERGFAQADSAGHTAPAVLALAIECIEAWALVDPEAWQRVYGKVPALPADPETLWGDVRDHGSNHPKCVLRRCFAEIDRGAAGNAPAQLLTHASLELLEARCPRGFGRFAADLRRTFPRIECVVAASRDRAIGLDGYPPWGYETLRAHVAHVRALVATTRDGERVATVASRKTAPLLARLPLDPRRLDLVITRTYDTGLNNGAVEATSFDDAVGKAAAAQVDRILVLGGGTIFDEALQHFRCTDIHYTRVDSEHPGADTFFDDFETNAAWVCDARPTHHHDNGFDYRIEHWSRFTPS